MKLTKIFKKFYNDINTGFQDMSVLNPLRNFQGGAKTAAFLTSYPG